MLPSQYKITALLTSVISFTCTFAQLSENQLPSAPLNYCYKTLAPRPSGRTSHGVAALGPDIYYIGGRIGADLTTSVDIYHTLNNTWSSAPPFPKPLLDPNVIAHNGRIYVLGGSAGVGKAGTISPSDGSLFPGEEGGRWETIAPNPRTRNGAVLGSAKDGKIWVAGGKEFPCGGTDVFVDSPAMLSYDVAADEWTAHDELTLPFYNSFGGGGIVNNVMYLLSNIGRSEIYTLDFTTLPTTPANFTLEKKCVAKVYAPKLPSGPWVPKFPPNGLRGIGNYGSAIVGTRFYTFGGSIPRSGTPIFDFVGIYDTVRDSWETGPPLKIPRSEIRAAAVREMIYLSGGYTRDGNGGDIHDSFGPC